MEPIRYYNRHTGAMETEQVYGEGFLRWAYGTPLGRLSLEAFVKRPFFSKFYGWRMDRPASAAKVAPFIVDYGMKVEDFADDPASFRSFNEFFYRKLKPAARPIEAAPVVFPADGRHLGFERAASMDGVFVKGQRFDLEKLLGSRELAARYADGPLVLSRLCPVDYHRFHFPCSGTPSATETINGPLFSVSPLALRQNLAYLWENKRTITRLETPDLGTVLLLEIGATCVGSILQTFTPGQPVAKGAEKGYFAFGGSSTITIFEPGRVALAPDLLENSLKQVETYARMGCVMATKH
ncbi:phosphatidylserine decarboxylase [Luteolibacter sp. LG18]|uniref:phosphatidylserine decarboxylase n=1 Tax=Luteolibacter sp. LG18 TaxID=2819286 RepID=UPI002B2DE370|nr:phosphatidylserine decarboxylase proenzyme [Luteolibacter sp. LG18]